MKPTPHKHAELIKQWADAWTVRETFYAFGRWETRFSQKKGRDEWHFVDMTLECGHSYCYDADQSNPVPMRGRRDAGVTPGWWKRPAIFMPRAASRISLEITGVRVERLQAISEKDAQAEGCKAACPTMDESYAPIYTYQEGFAQLWESINGKGSWEASPFVWAVEFKRIQPLPGAESAQSAI
jgi:hypothetical protein